jgi:hypothetical protein
MQKLNLNGSWTLDVIAGDGSAVYSKVPATVPGSVYHDLLSAGQIEDPFWRDNETEALKLMEHSFRYARSFEVSPELLAADAVRLRCEGLDTLATVEINGQVAGRADNMHRTWEFDVKALLRPGENAIAVTFASPTRFLREANAETFLDGVGHNIQVAVYDAATLGYKYSIDWLAESGQVEVCGLAVDREHGRVWMADWVQGHELYCYDIATRSYLGKVRLDPAPRLQQGIFCLSDGRMVISGDDGDADKDEPDHLYVCELYPGGRDLVAGSADGEPAVVPVSLFREMGDFRRAGEIEGLCFDPLDGALMVLSNRGSRIVLGMVKGFYEGYDREIHEIHIYR